MASYSLWPGSAGERASQHLRRVTRWVTLCKSVRVWWDVCAQVKFTGLLLTEGKRAEKKRKSRKRIHLIQRDERCVCLCVSSTVGHCYLQPCRPPRINGFSLSILGSSGPYFLLILCSLFQSLSLSLFLSKLQEHAHRCFSPRSQLLLSHREPLIDFNLIQ